MMLKFLILLFSNVFNAGMQLTLSFWERYVLIALISVNYSYDCTYSKIVENIKHLFCMPLKICWFQKCEKARTQKKLSNYSWKPFSWRILKY